MQNISVIISMYNIIMVTLNSLFIVKKRHKMDRKNWTEDSLLI